jgi:secreted trypsin-like serine protease
VYGQPDVNNEYDNVGAIVADFDGELFAVCTGTLIEPDVVLTAAHCLFGERMAVTFDNVLEENVADSTLHWGDAIGHDQFACCGSNDTFDIAVILLDEPVASIEPASLPVANALGDMSAEELRSARFETAGYGAIRDQRRTGPQALYNDPMRRYATQSINSLTKAWLTLSMNQATGNGGTCFGDSGGPHFLGDTVMSITITGDRWCKATDRTYRVDTAVARAFLGQFVALP